MNQIPPSVKYENPKATSNLSKSEVARLHKMLISGEHALSRKSDLVELHKRTIAMFATLKDGLGDLGEQKAEKDRQAVIARLDEMEQSVNSMEGMLRIEMAPKLRAMLNETVEEMERGRSSRGPRVFIMAIVLFAGIGLGAVFSAELTKLTSTTLTQISSYLVKE